MSKGIQGLSYVEVERVPRYRSYAGAVRSSLWRIRDGSVGSSWGRKGIAIKLVYLVVVDGDKDT